MIRPLLVALIAVAIFSCNKDDDKDNGGGGGDGIKPEDKAKAQALTQFLESNQFHLKKYYSETPIDYIDTDQVVKEETDLWQYVSTWLHDDAYSFASGTVTIQQNALKIPADSTPVLNRTYKVFADKDGVGFDFIGHEYQDLKYRLILFNDTMVKVSAGWNGKTVFSEYNKIP
jgi:hypothetical protein